MVSSNASDLVWPTEDLPDDARLFYRVHVNSAPDGVLVPGIFREQKGSMSADWEKYSTAEESRSRAPEPSRNGIVVLLAGPIRAIEGMGVQHAPIPPNRSHSAVTGMSIPNGAPASVRKTMVRAKLFHHFNTWQINPFTTE